MRRSRGSSAVSRCCCRAGRARLDVADRRAGAAAVRLRSRPVRGRPASRDRRGRRARRVGARARAGTVSFAGSFPGTAAALTIRTADGYSVTLLQLGSIGVRAATRSPRARASAPSARAQTRSRASRTCTSGSGDATRRAMSTRSVPAAATRVAPARTGRAAAAGVAASGAAASAAPPSRGEQPAAVAAAQPPSPLAAESLRPRAPDAGHAPTSEPGWQPSRSPRGAASRRSATGSGLGASCEAAARGVRAIRRAPERHRVAAASSRGRRPGACARRRRRVERRAAGDARAAHHGPRAVPGSAPPSRGAAARRRSVESRRTELRRGARRESSRASRCSVPPPPALLRPTRSVARSSRARGRPRARSRWSRLVSCRRVSSRCPTPQKILVAVAWPYASGHATSATWPGSACRRTSSPATTACAATTC